MAGPNQIESVFDEFDVAPSRAVESGKTPARGPIDSVFDEFDISEFDGPNEAEAVASHTGPGPNMVRIPGTETDIPEPAAALARIGIEGVGDLAGMVLARKLPISTASRVGRVAKATLESGAAGVGTIVGSLSAEGIDPTQGESPLAAAGRKGLMAFATDRVMTGVGNAVLKKLTGPGSLEPGAEEVIKRFGKTPESLPTAGRLSTGRAIDVAEVVTENSLFGGRHVKERLARAEVLGQEEVDAIIAEKLQGASRVEVSDLLKDLLSDQIDVFKSAGKDLFGSVDEAIAAEVAQSGASATYVNGSRLVLAQDSISKRITADKGGVSIALSLVDDAFKKAEAFGNYIDLPFGIAQELRSALLNIGRSDEPIVRSGKAAAKELAAILDESMEATGRSLTGDALQKFRSANKFWKNGRDTLKNQSIASILNAPNSDGVIDLIVSPGGTENLRQIRNAVFGGMGEDANITDAISVIAKQRKILASKTSSQAAKDVALQKINMANHAKVTWEKLQGQVFLDTVRHADPHSGMSERALFESQSAFDASKAKTRLGRFTDETLNELFPRGAGRKEFERAVRLVEFAQSPAGRNIPGGIFVQLGQAGAAASLLMMSGDLVAPATIIFGPALIGRLMNNKAFHRWLTIGVTRRSIGTTQRAFTQIANIALREGGRVIRSDGSEIDGQGDIRPPDFSRERDERNPLQPIEPEPGEFQ